MSRGKYRIKGWFWDEDKKKWKPALIQFTQHDYDEVTVIEVVEEP